MGRIIFSINAGSVYYVLGNWDKAKEYYEDVIEEISKRMKVLQKIYKKDLFLTRSAALGNIGLIYSDKGDLDKALEYLQEALKIFSEMKALNLVVQTLVNFCYFL